MTLFDIDAKYRSHPGYPLKWHQANAADSFEEAFHKESALFHDIGKLTQEFQNYIDPDKKGKATTHSLESALIYLVYKNYRFSPEVFAVFYSILRHHGNLEDTNNYFYDRLSYPDDILDNYPNILKRLEKICQHLSLPFQIDLDEICSRFDSDEFVQENHLSSIHNYFFVKEVFSRLIFSDKYEAIFKKSYLEGKAPNWDEYIPVLEKLVQSKKNELSAVRTQARKEILNNYRLNKNKSIFIIEAPTGIGKTFSALHLALAICRDKKKKRIINALPMTSIIDQAYDAYSDVLGEEELLKFHHLTHSKGYVFHESELNNEKISSSGQQNDFIAMSWSSDRVIVTTFNQLLNVFYSNKNKDIVKFWTIRDSVIILDEIQAIPRVLIQDIAKTLSYLSKEFNIDFILMSATIPEIKEFISEKIVADLLDNKYFSMDFNNRYSIEINPRINDKDSLIATIKENFNRNDSLLCVVNSKKFSYDLFMELSESHGEFLNSQLFFLNTNFIPKHRKEIIRDVKERLSCSKNKKTLLISTQVVEAGVDLDFDFGIREFAPLFSMVQTAGRINRENREGVNTTAKLLVTDSIGYCPYHANDLLKDETIDLFTSIVNENKILPLLKTYFKIALDRTPKDPLLYQDMQILNYNSVNETYENNFMKAVPNLVPVFIEIEKNLYQSFHLQIESLYLNLQNTEISLEERMEYRSQLKGALKRISQYVVNIAKDEADDLQDFHKIVHMKVCPYKFVRDETKYSLKKGWQGEKTLTCWI